MKKYSLQEVDELVSQCIIDPTLAVIIRPSFYEELLEEKYFGPLEHYDRIRYHLCEISRIGLKYGKIPDGCIIEAVDQLEAVLDCFYLMDTGREDYCYNPATRGIFMSYFYPPTFLRNAMRVGRFLGSFG